MVLKKHKGGWLRGRGGRQTAEAVSASNTRPCTVHIFTEDRSIDIYWMLISCWALLLDGDAKMNKTSSSTLKARSDGVNCFVRINTLM